MNAMVTVGAERSLFEDWGKARAYLLPALVHAHGTHSENDVLAGVVSGRFRLWLGHKAAVLTEFVQYDRLKAINWFLVGGDMDEIKGMEPAIIAYAKEHGCSREMCHGRKGWERALTHWRFCAITLYRDI